MAVRRLIFQDQTFGFYEEVDTTADEFSIGKISLAGISNISLDGGADRAENFADPVNAQDLTTKNYVDNLIEGLVVQTPARVATTADLASWTVGGSGVGKTLTSPNDLVSHNDFDGVTTVVGNRILVKNQGGGASHADNGIYEMTTLADGAGQNAVITRVTDFDEDAEVIANSFIFVEEGTTLADTGWVLVTNNPITVDTTAQEWQQFSSSGTVTADAGLLKSGNAFSVELDTDADAQTAGANGGSSGLEFDVTGVAGQLRVRVGLTGAINRLADGLGIEVDPQANTVGNNPSVATSAAGLSVLRSPIVGRNDTANEAIAIGDPVQQSATNDRVEKSDAATNSLSLPHGVAITAATAAAETLSVVERGLAVGALAGVANGPAVAGDRIYLNPGTGLLVGIPAANNRVVYMGKAANANDLRVDIRDYGRRGV